MCHALVDQKTEAFLVNGQCLDQGAHCNVSVDWSVLIYDSRWCETSNEFTTNVMNPHLRKKMKKQYSCQLYLLLAALVSE